MPELLHPGVYVFEISSGVRPIEGVSTSTAAFLGKTDRGPLPGTSLPGGKPARPTLITSFTDYVRQYGGFRSDSFLTYSVQAFFNNGGRRIYIVRVGNKSDPPVRAAAGTNLSTAASPGARATAISAGDWAGVLNVSIAAASNGDAGSFDLVTTAASRSGEVEVERLKDLPFGTAKATINAATGSKLVRIPTPPNAFTALPSSTLGLTLTKAGTVSGAGWAAATITTAGAGGIAVTARRQGAWANTLLSVRILAATSGDPAQFDLEVSFNGVVVELFRNLAPKSTIVTDPIPANYVQSVVNAPDTGSLYVTIPADVTARPADTAAAQALVGGTTGGTGDTVAWGPASTMVVTAANEGLWGNNLSIVVSNSADGNPAHFRLSVFDGVVQVESFDDLAFSPTGTPPWPDDYAPVIVNGRSESIAIDLTNALTARPANGRVLLAGGKDGGAPDVADFVGAAALPTADVTGTGFRALDKITDVSLIAAPGRGEPELVNAGMAYCKVGRPLADCFFIGDMGSFSSVDKARVDGAQPSVRTLSDARDFATTGFNGVMLDKSTGDHGAIYYPWVLAADPIGTGRNPRILLPPSGFMAGIYARTDNSRGVFKAPAGTEAGVVGAIAVATTVSDADQDSLNPIKVNVIRTVPGSGIVVWGTRTIGSDAEWRYIPVRRTAIFLRTSIYYGIQWAVFEPNDEPLWSSLRLNIRSFMLTQFRAGAFQGSKPDDAFFVACDSSTTTQTDIDNGVVNILVGFAPLKPAEFVVLRLQQKVNQQVA